MCRGFESLLRYQKRRFFSGSPLFVLSEQKSHQLLRVAHGISNTTSCKLAQSRGVLLRELFAGHRPKQMSHKH